jgi:hypothetical protein
MLGRLANGVRIVRRIIVPLGAIGDFFLLRDGGFYIIKEDGDKVIIRK